MVVSELTPDTGVNAELCDAFRDTGPVNTDFSLKCEPQK